MVRIAAALPIALIAAPLAAQPTPASLASAPAAQSLFDRDWVLTNWALKYYDANRDIMIEPAEAQAAAVEFRKVADTDNDGRVTTEEFRAARAFILARY